MLRIANLIQKIAGTLPGNDKELISHIVSYFRENGYSLSSRDDKKKTDYKYVSRIDKDSFSFELDNPDMTSRSLMEGLSSTLTNVGFQTVLLNKNSIIIRSPQKFSDYFDDVVSMLGAIQSKDGMILNGMVYSFDISPKNVMTVRNSKGLISTACSYTIDSVSPKRIADVIRYQDRRYQSIFNEESYDTWFLSSPLKLKKHAIFYLGESRNLIVAPDDESYLVTGSGECQLTRPEGRRNLDIHNTFRTIESAARSQMSKGSVYKAFGHLLEKRGLIF